MNTDQKAGRNRGSTTTQSRPQRRAAAFAIPLVVVAVVAVLIAGLVLSYRGWQPQADTLAAEGAVATARPLPTKPRPYPDVPRLSLQEAQAQLAAGQAVLIDVRSRSSYDKVHAAGALSFPEDEIQDRLGDLPQGVQLILYCT